MSAIPPNPLSSIIQIAGAQQRAATDKAREVTRDAETRESAFAEKLRDKIEDTDADTSVYADAEGAGSQGRAFDEGGGTDADDSNDSGAAPKHDAPDEPGQRLDIEA
ncbi:MAG: hypothetical protein KDA32_11945 [Phycisphaerales bacterium]|nr:hypothetical protein [Phycisphaerales bacterium]